MHKDTPLDSPLARPLQILAQSTMVVVQILITEMQLRHNCTISSGIEDLEVVSPTNQTIIQLEEMDQKTHYFNLGIYAAIVLALVVTSMIRTVYFFIMCMRASVKLHNSMFMRVVRAPSRFFDTNPVGKLTDCN